MVVGGWGTDEQTTTTAAAQAAQTVMVMCGTALSPQIRAASRNVPYFFSSLQDPSDHSCQDSVIQAAMHSDLQSVRSSSGLEATAQCVKLTGSH